MTIIDQRRLIDHTRKTIFKLQARRAHKYADQGMSIVDIAKKMNKPESTVRAMLFSTV